MNFRRLQWLFPVFVTLHNFEEAYSYARFVSEHGRELPWSLDPSTFVLAAALLAGAAWLMTYYSWRQGAGSLPAFLLAGFMAAMLLNVVIPHLLAAIRLRSYVPGLITALGVNLPGMAFLLVRAWRAGYLTRGPSGQR